MKRYILVTITLVVTIIILGLIVYRYLPKLITHPTATPQLPQPSLKTLAQPHKVALGNFAMPKLLGESAYSDILSQQFDFAVIDNQPNWHFTDYDLRPTEKTFDFSRIDQVVGYAEDRHMPIQAHHFVWGEEKWLPDWLKKGNYTSQQLLDIMHTHITTVGEHYRGRIQEWTVVNEAFTRGQHVNGLHDWWADHIGGQGYIDQAFIWAHQADPNAVLILNDFGNETENSVSDAMYTYIKSAHERGIPVSAIGMQMHIDGTHPPKKDDVIANMRRFADLGVGVYVTEFDVNMNDVKASDANKDKIEGDIYYEMLRACIESQACHSFAYLGITDKETWYNYLPLENARPLMFDENYQPKPAYYSTRRALEQP